MSERGVCLRKEGDGQGLSNMRCPPAAPSLEGNSVLPLAQAIALRIYSYCKMVLANPLWAEEENSPDRRNAHTDATTSTEGFYTGINILVIEK